MKTWIVCDLDGTLCDSSHRDHLAREKQWDEFHSLLHLDKVHFDVAYSLRLMQAGGMNVVMLSGRNERYRELTYNWLATKAHFNPEHIILRPDNNYETDAVLKPRMLAEFLACSIEEAPSHVLMILDDRDKVVEAWRNLGFRCWQTQPGGY
jgi:FMN phosphatase YigB (HAD superfamily)